MAFGETAALSDLSFSVQPGEIHALVGENGAGKTTLFKILTGQHRAETYAGEIWVGGERMRLGSVTAAVRAGIGGVPRRFGVFDQLSVAENVTLGHGNTQGFFISRKAIQAQAEAALQQVGLPLTGAEPAGRLAAGSKRLLMIARAAHLAPKVVALDEPSSGLSTAQDLSGVFRAVRGLAERGIGCLYLTQRSHEALQIADRISVLRDGQLVGSWERPAFDERAILQALPSHRIGGAYVDHDVAETAPGLLGSLRTLFGPRAD
jgi:ABC-type sugar transport system ATPase subunit